MSSSQYFLTLYLSLENIHIHLCARVFTLAHTMHNSSTVDACHTEPAVVVVDGGVCLHDDDDAHVGIDDGQYGVVLRTSPTK